MEGFQEVLLTKVISDIKKLVKCVQYKYLTQTLEVTCKHVVILKKDSILGIFLWEKLGKLIGNF